MGAINVKSAETLKKEFLANTRTRLTSLIQSTLDEKAKERNYDSMLSLCTYATSPSKKFSSEGKAGVKWRDEVWAKGYTILSDVESGERTIPSDDELISELPEFTWPV